jgi:hypothetical protein
MTNIEKCKAALAQGLRVQFSAFSGHWVALGETPSFGDPDEDYRIHPDDEAKFVKPGATPAHTNLSTRTINGRTYTHRLDGSLCRILCTNFWGRYGSDLAVAVLDLAEGFELMTTVKSERLTPGTDPAFDVDWSKVAIDTPIWVLTGGDGTWHARHFAGMHGGLIQAWDNGLTSHTATTGFSHWREARLTKPEGFPK